MTRFAVTAVHCEHRVGKLAIGDCAVWVGVSADHRGAAFDACRYVIDETKARVPIWKKEHYASGATAGSTARRGSPTNPRSWPGSGAVAGRANRGLDRRFVCGLILASGKDAAATTIGAIPNA